MVLIPMASRLHSKPGDTVTACVLSPEAHSSTLPVKVKFVFSGRVLQIWGVLKRSCPSSPAISGLTSLTARIGDGVFLEVHFFCFDGKLRAVGTMPRKTGWQSVQRDQSAQFGPTCIKIHTFWTRWQLIFEQRRVIKTQRAAILPVSDPQTRVSLHPMTMPGRPNPAPVQH